MTTLLPPRLARAAFLLLLLSANGGRVAAAEPSPELARSIDAMLSRYLKPGAPGATVIVTDHGQPLFRKAYGMADVAGNVVLDPAMSLRVGSITKQFTAAAIMLLAEQGKLALSDRIDKYLPGYPMTEVPVTIEHLLTHTSGIQNYTALPGFGKVMTADTSVDDGIAFFKDAAPEFKPGDRFAYSNSNYFLLGAIIERVSGMAYADFMAQQIFAPLQLTHTVIETGAAAGPVIGYTQDRRNVVASPNYSMRWPYAAGALRTSVDDLALWDQAIAQGKLLKPESWNRMSTSYLLHGKRPTGYGYGFFIRTMRGKAAIEHGGDIGGFSADTLRFPQEGIFIAVLGNSDSASPAPDALAEKIAAIVLQR